VAVEKVKSLWKTTGILTWNGNK